MRIRTHGVATAAMLSSFIGASACASTTTQAPNGVANSELAALRKQQSEQTRRIAELETRLALLEADARQSRHSDDDASPLPAAESVRIGSSPTLTNAVSVSERAEELDDVIDNGKRPSLRLYGNGTAAAPAQRPTLSAVPQVNERLPVVPLPEQRAAKALRANGAAAASSDGSAREQYRKGLRALQDRRFEDALAQFDAFVTEHPRHELVASALYWRGEAHYAKRDYSAASKELESLVERFPSAQHTPDALLKLGLSLRKLGAQAKADAAFQRLRTDYPNSQAAQVAAREGST